MHRTRTTVLAGMAAFALSGCVVLTGCVAVEPRPAPAPPLPPPGSGRPAQVVGPQRVPDPAREALAPPAAEKTAPPAAIEDAPRKPSRPGPAKPATAKPAARPRDMPARPARPTKPVAPVPVGVPPGVCALSEDYGHWRPGSTEARICREVYGN
ncbi:hypothetical protein OH805_32010 [Streptomyces sp. NBC_00879]|uniref:hypothetical protein n=1 Tax=Streptomyces sp. NBC_00879 TaxID=2975855 RepID=UPI00386C1B6A|nr:hypothetical protein OH805_32010 [Streptomyces sp. NBC_00879]